MEKKFEKIKIMPKESIEGKLGKNKKIEEMIGRGLSHEDAEEMVSLEKSGFLDERRKSVLLKGLDEGKFLEEKARKSYNRCLAKMTKAGIGIGLSFTRSYEEVKDRYDGSVSKKTLELMQEDVPLYHKALEGFKKIEEPYQRNYANIVAKVSTDPVSGITAIAEIPETLEKMEDDEKKKKFMEIMRSVVEENTAGWSPKHIHEWIGEISEKPDEETRGKFLQKFQEEREKSREKFASTFKRLKKKE